ncbi:hypothetical protein ACN42_g10431 [Penicillium freii]|uniref:Uncharacterized protein n=1 Tax=Penicillium freii TaxID=48697 RepID=A0A101MA52_PENFR|nr:hypothetical protein ACN42_g10431 [Penicillium freii]
MEYYVEYQAWCMVGITKSIQTGKSMDRHDNGTIQNYIHCLIIDVRTDWKTTDFVILYSWYYTNSFIPLD